MENFARDLMHNQRSKARKLIYVFQTHKLTMLYRYIRAGCSKPLCIA